MDVQHCTKPCPNDIITINENNNNDYTLKTSIHTSKKCQLPFHEYLFPRKSIYKQIRKSRNCLFSVLSIYLTECNSL